MKRERPGSNIPKSSEPPKFIPSFPQSSRIGLNADTVEDFMRWVAAVPVSEAQSIRDQIAKVRNNDSVLEALVSNLFQLPITDFGRHQLLLSIIGELRNPKSVEHLVRFINISDDEMLSPPPRGQGNGLNTSYLDYAAALKARATEMLAFVGTQDALSIVLKIASEHGSKAVRLAALDSFAFNHGDSPEAIKTARAAAKQGEDKLVNLPRRERGFNPEDFDAKVRAFYERHPEEVPPTPEYANTNPPRERRRIQVDDNKDRKAFVKSDEDVH